MRKKLRLFAYFFIFFKSKIKLKYRKYKKILHYRFHKLFIIYNRKN